jgi:hypothetical protein
VLATLITVALTFAQGAPAKLFEFQDPRITESSGVAASARRADVLFTHNDSGDSARFFAVDRRGCTVGTFSAPGVDAVDWEDMARGPAPDGSPALFLGDIGDNGAGRSEIAVHRFPEPALEPATGGTGDCPSAPEQSLAPVSFRLAYEDGPHDAETLLVHPRSGQVFIVTKNFAGPDVLYAAPPVLDPGKVNVLRRVAVVEGLIAPTGGDIAPDASSVAVRDYGSILVWRIPGGDLPAAFAPGATPERLSAPDAGRQGEALAFTRAGDGLLTSAEGSHAPVYLVPRPAAAPCRRRAAVGVVPLRVGGRPRPLRRVRATVDGRPARVTVRAGTVRVSLARARRRQGRAVVRITARTRAGRRVSATRRVAVCA